MSRKRDKPYLSRHAPYSFPKRRRPPTPFEPAEEDPPENAPAKISTAVVVIGLSPDCSILDLKSRFEIYGSISRTRMDPGGVAYVTFRSRDAAEAAVAAALDSSFGITLNSKRLQVMLASDPVPQWRDGVGYKEGSTSRTASKLVRAEVPLSRQGRRGNKLGSAVVNPRDDNEDNSNNNNNNGGSKIDLPFKGREIVAYDDIL